jgi:hypothetical protein
MYLIVYDHFTFGGLLPRPLPEGLPVVLGPFGGRLLVTGLPVVLPEGDDPLLDFAPAH